MSAARSVNQPGSIHSLFVPHTSNSKDHSFNPDERAVHRIQLSALRHNYAVVESAANRQRCSVIVVVKADGYGHGAVETALHLADYCGADAFAVATLEEGIALRHAFLNSIPGTGGDGAIGKANINPTSTAASSSAIPTPVRQRPQRDVYSEENVTENGSTMPITDDSVVSSLEDDVIPSQHAPFHGTLLRSRHSSSSSSLSTTTVTTQNLKCQRPNRIRIIVLGPPVGYPTCFNLYLHFQIELMVSGQEVANALMEWVENEPERKRAEVQKAAEDSKEIVLGKNFLTSHPGRNEFLKGGGSNDERQIAVRDRAGCDDNLLEKEDNAGETNDDSLRKDEGGKGNKEPALKTKLQAAPEKSNLGSESQTAFTSEKSSSLSAVSGYDLAKEVREILISRQTVEAQNQRQQAVDSTSNAVVGSNDLPGAPALLSRNGVGVGSGGTGGMDALEPEPLKEFHALSKVYKLINNTEVMPSGSGSNNAASTAGTSVPVRPLPFRGIEDTAKVSRLRERAVAKVQAVFAGEEDESLEDQPESRASPIVSVASGAVASGAVATALEKGNGGLAPPLVARKKLRWHALVDTGMGRLGFRTVEETGEGEKDSFSTIKNMNDAEIYRSAPIEFYGLCTHMADSANSDATYTERQMSRFKSFLKGVRDEKILVPTISTDNSSALLTTTLTHFDPESLLSQAHANTRGFVRTGGAVFGQRPAFSQLRSISTLTASVRNVATLQKGESVGYDRAYVAQRNVRIATLTIGFADGYPRELGNGKGEVSIHGEKFHIVGNVCMDMVMIDLGPAEDHQGTGAKVCVGDTATLWGPENVHGGNGLVSLQDIAEKLETTQSALTCGLDKVRVRRIYV